MEDLKREDLKRVSISIANINSSYNRRHLLLRGVFVFCVVVWGVVVAAWTRL